MRRLLARLEASFFRPGDLGDLATVRIILAAAYLIRLHPALREQLRLAREAPSFAFVPLPALKVLLLPFGGWGIRPDPMLIEGIWLASVLAAGLVLVGLWTGPAGFVWAATYSLLVAHGYSFGEFHHPEAPFAIALWILAFSHWGATRSLDRLRVRARVAREEGVFRPTDAAARASPEATWPLRAIQWVLAICYASAGLYKATRGGLTWLNGHTLSFYLTQDAVRWNRPVALAVAARLPVVKVLSFFTLAFELSFVVAALVPTAALLYVPAGLAMHAGIWYLMDAAFPQWMVLYVAFLPSLRHGWRRLRRVRPGDEEARPPRRIVVYDGACRLCLGTMAILDELDLGGRLSFLDGQPGKAALPDGVRGQDVLHSMHVVEGDGTVRKGFHAFRSVAQVTPLLWPLLPLLYAPGAQAIGPRVYAAVSSRRRRCASGACGLP